MELILYDWYVNKKGKFRYKLHIEWISHEHEYGLLQAKETGLEQIFPSKPSEEPTLPTTRFWTSSF